MIQDSRPCMRSLAVKRRGRSVTRMLCVSASLLLAAPAAGEPLDACGLAPSAGVTLPPEEAIVTAVTGPNSVLTSTGHEIRLASVTTPHRLSLPPSHAAEDLNVVRAVEGQPETTAESGRSSGSESDASQQPDPIAEARSTLSAWLLGHTVRIYPVTPPPDRYGRRRARVVRVGDGSWIEAELVKAGLARTTPQSDDFGCARRLEAIEDAARRAHRGLWALPEFAVLDADDITRDRFIGSYVLVGGTVVSVGTSGTRHYLNFGQNFRRDFAIVLVDKGATVRSGQKPMPNRFRDEGFLGRDVVGQRIRVRGVLLATGGGQMMPGEPEEIEWVTERP